MEGLKKRTLTVALVLVATGLALHAMPRPAYARKDEAFMEKAAPVTVNKFKFLPDSDNPLISYKVDDVTRTVLKPFGCVGRIYSDGKEAYDVLLISSNDKNSFHDNRICFQSQGYTITGQSTESLETARGTIPVTIVEVTHNERGKMFAAMFYKGPHQKWYPLNYNLTWGMFVEQLKMGDNLDSTFYRVIPSHQNASKDNLLAFIKDYVVAAEKSSNGFF